MRRAPDQEYYRMNKNNETVAPIAPIDKELKKMKITLIELLKDESINRLERWHMRVIYDVLCSNVLDEKRAQISNVLNAYQMICQTCISHASLKSLRTFIKDNQLKLEF